MRRFPQSDYLFLLIGSNPLPNYVAAKLLAKRSAVIYLLYSEAEENRAIPNTKLEAEYLQQVLEKDGVTVAHPRGIHDSAGRIIETRLKKICQEANIGSSQSIGLHYTGATKPMAVHTHRILRQLYPKRCQCSYLDPRRMAFFFDDQPDPVKIRHDDLHVSLETLANLHGYKISQKQPPRREPQFPKQFPKLLPALLKIHQTVEGVKAWRAWLYTDMEQFPDAVVLKPVRQKFLDLCSGKEDADRLADVLGKYPKLASYKKWFTGGWLEDMALQAIKANARQFGLQHYAAGLKPKPLPKKKAQYKEKAPPFDVDVAAMLGYQLFAVSCIASKKANGETKKHLFEAYVRARQLGGDETKVALVCLVDNPGEVERTIARDWHVKGQIKLFGYDDLQDTDTLNEAFRDWFCQHSLYRERC